MSLISVNMENQWRLTPEVGQTLENASGGRCGSDCEDGLGILVRMPPIKSESADSEIRHVQCGWGTMEIN